MVQEELNLWGDYDSCIGSGRVSHDPVVIGRAEGVGGDGYGVSGSLYEY